MAASNAALVKACHSEQVMLADHTDTFTTNSGAHRKALYRDTLHPSPNGTMRLACNVIAQELCESRGGRPGLSALTNLLVSVDVKLY